MSARAPGSRQLPLDLPVRQALGREDFLVTASNADAVAVIDRWPDWTGSVLFLVGPPGSGKTHLGETWRRRSDALGIGANELTEESVAGSLGRRALLVEDAPGDGRQDERALFHLLNLAREQQAHVLLTSRALPALWRVTLPDLRSRLRAASTAVIGPPDDALLRGVLVKLFADRQIAADEAIISFMLSRMERSLETARDLVAEIDRQALAERAELTRAFVARVLAAWRDRDPLPGDAF